MRFGWLAHLPLVILDVDITTHIKRQPFTSIIKLQSNMDFFHVRDEVAKALNRRSQDLELGYIVSWWTAQEKKEPRALMNDTDWNYLIEAMKLWLAGGKNRSNSNWFITIMDRDDASVTSKKAPEKGNKNVHIFTSYFR